MDDAELVRATRNGDLSAFTAIFDRHSARVHDLALAMLRDRILALDVVEQTFLEASLRMHGLEEDHRLGVWLLAITRRNGALRAGPTAGPDRQPSLPNDDPERVHLASLVWEAVADLPLRDRTLLDLDLRQGLDGHDLADSLGVTLNQAQDLQARMRDRIEKGLSGYLIARTADGRCPDLTKVLKGWGGRFTPRDSRRIADHVDGCRICNQTRFAIPSPFALYAAALPAPFPAVVRARVVDRVVLPAGPAGGLGIAAAGPGSMAVASVPDQAFSPTAGYQTPMPLATPSQDPNAPIPGSEAAPAAYGAVPSYPEPAPYPASGQGYAEPAPYPDTALGYADPTPSPDPALGYAGPTPSPDPAPGYLNPAPYPEPGAAYPQQERPAAADTGSPYPESAAYGEPTAAYGDPTAAFPGQAPPPYADPALPSVDPASPAPAAYPDPAYPEPAPTGYPDAGTGYSDQAGAGYPDAGAGYSDQAGTGYPDAGAGYPDETSASPEPGPQADLSPSYLTPASFGSSSYVEQPQPSSPDAPAQPEAASTSYDDPAPRSYAEPDPAPTDDPSPASYDGHEDDPGPERARFPYGQTVPGDGYAGPEAGSSDDPEPPSEPPPHPPGPPPLRPKETP